MNSRRWGFRVSLLGALCLAGACGAAQVPPGPEPEYQRPEVIPWDASVAQADPLTGIEDGGEWVTEVPGEGGAPSTPAPDPLRPPAPPKP